MNIQRKRAAFYVGLLAMVAVPIAALLAQSSLDYRKPPEKEWPVVGGDWGNTRYTPLSQLNTTNVKTLKGAWMARLSSGFGPGFSQQATPVVKDGVMYITTGEQDVFALDARTGNIIWEYRSPWDRRTPDNKAKRGVGLGDGMVFGVEVDIRPLAPTTGTAWRSPLPARAAAAGARKPDEEPRRRARQLAAAGAWSR